MRRPGLALVIGATVLLFASAAAAVSEIAAKPSSLSPRLREAIDRGPAPASEIHRIVVSLALRSPDVLEAYLAEVQDPASPLHGRFLTQEQFNAVFGPTVEEEVQVVTHLEQSGLTVTDRAPNRLLVGAVGTVAALRRAFSVDIHHVDFRGQLHYAAVNEPVVPDDLAPVVLGVLGLDDLGEMQARVRPAGPVAAPHAG